MADTQFLKISEVIRPETVDLDLKNIGNKDQVIHYLAGLLDDAGLITDKQAYIDSVYERESMGPTYMVPSLSVGLAMLVAKNKFTEDEHGELTGCFIGAATFITEFAIPYAAADPLRVIPSIMVGSAVGAVVSFLFGVTLQAPHGGLFVFALSNKPLLWILSIIIGGVAGAAMLVLLKPDLKKEKK